MKQMLWGVRMAQIDTQETQARVTLKRRRQNQWTCKNPAPLFLRQALTKSFPLKTFKPSAPGLVERNTRFLDQWSTPECVCEGLPETMAPFVVVKCRGWAYLEWVSGSMSLGTVLPGGFLYSPRLRQESAFSSSGPTPVTLSPSTQGQATTEKPYKNVN